MTSVLLVLLAFQSDPALRRMEAVELLQAGKTFEAEALLTELATAYPQEVENWYLLGEVLYRVGLFERARLSFERVVALNPKNTTARVRLAVSIAKTGTLEAGERACRELLLNPSVPPNVDLLMSYVQLLVESGRAEQALPYADQAAKLWPEDSVVRSWRARVWLALGKFGDAEREASQAASLAPQSPVPHATLLRIYRAQSKTAEIAREAAWFRDHEGSQGLQGQQP
jgi:Flp pilus assembly protein TadD